MEYNQPSWNSVVVSRHIPDKLKNLEVLSKNLWWCWNESAKELFMQVNPNLWESTGNNPIEMLGRVSSSRYRELENDHKFLADLGRVMEEFDEYMSLNISVWNTALTHPSRFIQAVSEYLQATTSRRLPT